MIQAFGHSVTGRRERNEDSYAVRSDLGLFVVADGMGGHAGGNVASRLVVDTVERFFDQMGDGKLGFQAHDFEPSMAEQRVGLAVRMCKAEVERRAIGELARMGSTLAMVLVRERRVILAHVGDSRIYRLRDGCLAQMTRDHSLYAELMAAGGHELASRLTGPYVAMITRSIAVRTNAMPDIAIEQVRAGDRYLLCSDGLSGALEDDVIGQMLRTHGDPQEASCRLVQLAYSAGSMDNITAVVVDLD